MTMHVVQICPYEPPASGWTTRVKLLRHTIQERGGQCDILDIGPSRKLQRPDCMSVMHGWDYLCKVVQFARKRCTFHCHVNGHYFRGVLLMLTACLVARIMSNRCLVTFHGGAIQPFLRGWRRRLTEPLYWLLFSLADSVICNSEMVKSLLSPFQKATKIKVIPAFSQQYLTYETVALEASLAQFIASSKPLLSTYLCFRDGFFTDVVLQGMVEMVRAWPQLGLVIVGTGDDMVAFREQVQTSHLTSHIYLTGNLERNAFLTLMAQSDAHIRSPISDGISSTVLEALALRIPVVASENGARPPSVITYRATDPLDLAQRLHEVLTHHGDVVASLQAPSIEDTAQTEVDLLLGTPSSDKHESAC